MSRTYVKTGTGWAPLQSGPVGPQGPIGGTQVYTWFNDGTEVSTGGTSRKLMPLKVIAAQTTKMDGTNPDFVLNPNGTIQVKVAGFYQVNVSLGTTSSPTTQVIDTELVLAPSTTDTDIFFWDQIFDAQTITSQNTWGWGTFIHQAVAMWFDAGANIAVILQTGTSAQWYSVKHFSITRTGSGPKGDQGIQGIQGPSGGPLITGGKTREFLVKSSDTDFAASWVTDAAIAVTTANTSVASASYQMDDVTLTAGDIVLLAGQTDPKQNGLYRFAGSSQPLVSMGPIRAGELVTVGGGTFQKKTVWQAIGQYSQAVLLAADNKYFTRISPPYDPWSNTSTEVSRWSSNLASGTATMAQAMATAALSPISGYYNYIGLTMLRAGRTYTGLQWYTGPTAGSGLTSQWSCVVGADTNYGKILGTCQGMGGSTIAANQSYSHYFTPTFTALRDELVWIVLVVTGTTMPTFLSAPAHPGLAFNVYSSPPPIGRGSASAATYQPVSTSIGGPSTSVTCPRMYCIIY